MSYKKLYEESKQNYNFLKIQQGGYGNGSYLFISSIPDASYKNIQASYFDKIVKKLSEKISFEYHIGNKYFKVHKAGKTETIKLLDVYKPTHTSYLRKNDVNNFKLLKLKDNTLVGDYIDNLLPLKEQTFYEWKYNKSEHSYIKGFLYDDVFSFDKIFD